MTESEDSLPAPILICTHCGTAQYRVPESERFYCLACGESDHRTTTAGSWLYAYSELRLHQEGPLTGAMLLLRREREGTPITANLAVKLTHSVSRYRVARMRKLLERQFFSFKRFRVTPKG